MGVVDKLKMKSRSYIGMAIYEPNGIDRTAVIVFESLRPSGINKEKIKSIFNDKVENEIKLLIDVLKPIEPSLDIAKKGGF